MLCCRCNAGGKCLNCICIKSKRQCSNCLHSRKGSCSNTKQPAATPTPDTITMSQAPPHEPAKDGTPTVSPTTNSPPINAHLVSPAAAPAPKQMPPCLLPPASQMANPSFVWGDHNSTSIIQSLNTAYSEAVHWRKNTFLVPLGNPGRSFVFELSSAYAEGSALEAVALKACTVLSILLLQKPFKS